MGNVIESIYSDNEVVIPLADVQHIEKLKKNGEPTGICIITNHTKWNFEHDVWENAIYISKGQDEIFLKAWSNYRYELEKDTLVDQDEIIIE